MPLATLDRMNNAQIADALRDLAFFLEMEGVEFKPRAFEKAAYTVEALDRPLEALHAAEGTAALERLPGIGHGIASRIDDLLRTGHIPELDRLHARCPIDLPSFAGVEGLGPRSLKALYDGLGVRDLDGLEAACRAGKVRDLPHFGERSEEKLLQAIELKRQAAGRRPLGEVLPLARTLLERLRALPAVARAELAGSARRGRDTIGDLDLLVAGDDPEPVARAFVAYPEVVHVHAQGPTKCSVRLATGFDADLRVVPPASFGAAWLYFTGSKAHGIALRRIAWDRALKLNEYGLFDGERCLASRTEAEVYEALGLPFIEPELREDRGEIEAAATGTLPRLLEHGALRGDLQVQTDWTDGAHTIEQMVESARAIGLEYIAITDHTRDLAMTHGSDEYKLRAQMQAIHKLNRGLRGFRVLAGAEVNVRRDGTLDIADETLAELDVVGAAVHTHFHLPRAEQTARIVRALENPHVDVLFHPTGRSLGRRAPMEFDFDAVLAAAGRTGTALEIDAQPDRMDLDDERVRKAVDAGVPLVVDSDAHHQGHLRYADELGVTVARRGWATARDVLNTRGWRELHAALKDGRHRSKRR